MSKRVSNKKAKQMICDAVRNWCKGNCGHIYWESTSDFVGAHSYPNQLLVVDGMFDVEYSFWYSPPKVSLTASELKGE